MLFRSEKELSKQQQGESHNWLAHSSFSSGDVLVSANGHNFQGHCWKGKTSFLASCPNVIITALRTVATLACGQQARSPQKAKSRSSSLSGRSKRAVNFSMASTAGLSLMVQKRPSINLRRSAFSGSLCENHVACEKNKPCRFMAGSETNIHKMFKNKVCFCDMKCIALRFLFLANFLQRLISFKGTPSS